MAVGHQADHDPAAAEHQHPPRHGGSAGNAAAVLDHADHRRQRADRVGDVVRAVGEGHGAGGEHHQHAEDALHAGEVIVAAGTAVTTVDAVFQQQAEHHDDHAERHRQQQAFTERQMQANVGEPLDQRHHRDDEADQEDIARHIALGRRERIGVVEDQHLHGTEQHEGEHASDQRRRYPTERDRSHRAPADRLHAQPGHRETDDGADDRVRGGNRPPLQRGDQQPGAGSKQRSQHAVDQHLRVVLEQGRIDDAFADRFGDLSAGQPGAEEFEDHRNDDRLLDRDRLGADRGSHGVGDVVRSNPPCHEETEDTGKNDEDITVLRNDGHRLLFA